MERSRGWQKFKSGMKRAYQRYDRMMEKQGFYVVLAICVLVIGLSAFYTFRLRSEEEEPVLTSGEAKSADSSQAQTLSEAKELVTGGETVLAVPTEAPFSLSQPVSGFLDRAFSDTEPQFFAQTNAWQVHAGIDLQAEYGTVVSACAGGKVERVWQDNELGLCVLIDHENGYETLYAGLSSADYVQAGDPVIQGQTLGHSGNGVLAESNGLPHLHLEVHKNGRPVDPLAAFLGLDNENML